MRVSAGAAGALLALGVAPAALALSLELKPSVHAEFRSDDNIFRAPAEAGAGTTPRVSDRQREVGVGATLRLRHSLQSLELRGRFDQVDYDRQNQLDHERYRLEAEARMALGSTLGADLDARRERRLESFAFRDDTQPGFVEADSASAALRYALTPRWTARAKADHYASRASLIGSRDYDLDEQGLEAGAEYRRQGYSSFGLFLREVQGEFPNRQVTPGDGREQDYRQRSLGLRAGYTPSGLSDFALQLGYTRREHDDAGVSDFAGLTGRLGYSRRLSGRSRLKAEAYRDLFYVEEADANYAENLGLSLSADYRYSAKLAFAAVLQRVESDYRGSPGVAVAGEARQDDLLSLSLGADYRPALGFSILPEYRYERRGSNALDSAHSFSVIGVDLAYEYGARLR